MNRRSFFTKAAGRPEPTSHKAFNPRPLNVTAGLEPHTTPLDRKAALHLLRRTGFQPVLADVEYATGKTASALVSEMLLEGKTEAQIATPPPGSWVNETPVIPRTLDEQVIQNNKHYELMIWWYDRMALAPIQYSLREKMTFFWHDHFANSRDKVVLPHLMYWQNDKFRRNPVDGKKADDPTKPTPTKAFGNIKELTRAMVSDAAMVLFLDNYVNYKGNANENLARELLELFTLGISTPPEAPRYTEEDVKEAARALTGWTIDVNYTTYEISPAATFRPFFFDSTPKTIFKKTENFNADSLVDIIFEKDACAKFFAEKSYKYFVYEIPDEKIVGELATLLKANNYELAPVLKTLLTSAHFFDQEFRGAQIKNPLDYMAGMARQFNGKPLPPNYGVTWTAILNLDVFNPPNVAGWPGYRDWINTTTYVYRQRLAEYFINTDFDIMHLANQFASKNDAEQLVKDLAEYMLPVEITAKQKDFLLGELLLGGPAYEWKITNPTAKVRLQTLFKAITRMPEYQLT